MILLFLSLFAIADEPIIVYKKETTIDFEAVDIEGQLKKPQGAFIQEKIKATFNPLIQLREHWGYEMEVSLKDIQ